MQDDTEDIRRKRRFEIEREVAFKNKEMERARLTAKYGQVWDHLQLSMEFEILGFSAPYVVVKRLSDGKKGSLEFQHHPRFYFNFEEDKSGAA